MAEKKKEKEEEKRKKKKPPTFLPGWAYLKEGHVEIAEEILQSAAPTFAVWKNGEVEYHSLLKTEDGEIISPIMDKLVKIGAICLPNEPEEYGTESDLFQAIQDYFNKWADLSHAEPRYPSVPDLDLKIASIYPMIEWLKGKVPCYPLMNIRGPSETGKSRIGMLLHLLSYRSIMGSGASTFAALLRSVDTWKGHLYLNEADLQYSTEESEKTKFLNSRYEESEGFQFKCETAGSEGTRWKPQVYYTFGPTTVVTRKGFDDDALESRCYRLYPEATVRTDIALNLPMKAKKEAGELRSQLLMFRFRRLAEFETDYYHRFPGIGNRLNQVLGPIASLARKDIPELYELLEKSAKEIYEDLVEERARSPEGFIIRAYLLCRMDPQIQTVSAQDIAEKIQNELGDRDMTAKKVGHRLTGLGFRRKRGPTATRRRILDIGNNPLHRHVSKYVPQIEREAWREFCVKEGQDLGRFGQFGQYNVITSLEEEEGADGTNGSKQDIPSAYTKGSSKTSKSSKEEGQATSAIAEELGDGRMPRILRWLAREQAQHREGVPLSVMAAKTDDPVKLNEYLVGMRRDGYVTVEKGLVRLADKGREFLRQEEEA